MCVMDVTRYDQQRGGEYENCNVPPGAIGHEFHASFTMVPQISRTKRDTLVFAIVDEELVLATQNL